ncbi:dethiobiotin synthase [Propionivibrio dicarboxylicus]|uniref:ATP-dependent dethiobiotin synthetase BioD n=1 Tax=Propionivibrio dicarboxylicus TaxID=83767 RepID=A0A1G7ZJB0_9RHOO|nr:dethiobiotin synthase [Propionivibrio dicarboxylicus]SDH08729.1 dethiobiotin synthetase [Propionivibrio dicarboxylicus]
MNAPKDHAWFIAGTDTEVGKTFSTSALLHVLKNNGVRALGMKPVAAGTNAAGSNDDVDALIAAAGVTAPLDLINPYLFEPPIAPHIAAQESGRTIDFDTILAAFSQLAQFADVVLVEGVGGFCVPLGSDCDAADLAQRLGLPVILVVGMRLGCINHALLTQEAIAARGLRLTGWIANRIDPAMSRFDENLAALVSRLKAPLLGVIPANSTPAAAAAHLRLPD